MTKLTENQFEVLNELEGVRRAGQGWATPLHIGGSNGSHHSGTLAALAKKGFVQFKQRYGEEPPEGQNGKKLFRGRGSKCYRITDAGLEAWRAHRVRT